MKAYVVVEFARPMDRELKRSRDASPEAAQLKDTLVRHGAAELTSSRDGTAMTFEVADPQRAMRLAAALQASSAVKSAYMKPGEELP